MAEANQMDIVAASADVITATVLALRADSGAARRHAARALATVDPAECGLVAARARRALGLAALADGSYLQAFTQLRALFSEPGTPLHNCERIQFAFGEPGLGVAGFRRTHQQAVSAQAVALAAGPTGPAVTAFAEVAPLALMSGLLELLRAWVAETLGPLAHDDENSARLRETLRVFLQENLSYKATAERLVLHKNTVQYRVRKAEESLEHPVAQDRLLIELALLASQRLGVAVLRPDAGVRA